MLQKKLLIAEDDAPLLKAMSVYFKKEGFFVIEVKNGEEAVQSALELHPDLIILDLLMPKKSGMQALHEIRKDSWGATVPVIVATNLPPGPEKDAAAEEGVTDYFTKSNVKLEDLVGSVKKQLGM
jgi:two-component system, OmpR family, KDP operon response regulator KdpE